MTEFETSAMLEVDVSKQSLTAARKEIESELGASVDVSAETGGSSARMAADGSGSNMHDMAITRNEYLSDILDELEAANLSGGGGGGGGGMGQGFLLSRMMGGGGSGGLGGAGGGGGVGGGSLLGGLLLGGSMTPGSPFFFGGGSKKENFESQQAKDRANENAQSTRQLLGLEEGQAFPKADQAFADQVEQITGGITGMLQQTPTNQSDATDLLNPYRKKVTQDGVAGRNQASDMLNQYRQRVTKEGVEGRTQATNMLNSYRTADSRGNKADQSKKEKRQTKVENNQTYNVELQRQGDLDRDMERLKQKIDQMERGFGGR